jgi:hypothetical protein
VNFTFHYSSQSQTAENKKTVQLSPYRSNQLPHEGGGGGGELNKM